MLSGVGMLGIRNELWLSGLMVSIKIWLIASRLYLSGSLEETFGIAPFTGIINGNGFSAESSPVSIRRQVNNTLKHRTENIL